MKTKLFPVLTDSINLILLYLLVVGAGSILETGMEMTMVTYDYIAIAFMIFGFYLLREYVTSLKFFAPGNILVFLAVIKFAPDFNSGLRVGFVTFVFMVLNAHYWIEQDGNSAMNIPWGMVAAFIPLSAYASSKGNSKIVTELFYFSVVFIVLELIKLLLKNAYELSISGQLTSDMPVKDIYRNSFVLAAVIVFLCIGLMLFVRADWLINLLNGLLQKIEYILLYLFFNMIILMRKEDTDTDVPQRIHKMLDENVEGGLFDQIINIIGALLVMVVLIGIAILIVKSIRNIIGEYGHRERLDRKGTDFEIRERIERTDRAKSKGFWAKKTNSEKIRLLYKKKMLSYLKKGIQITGNNTPKENAKQVLENTGGDLSEMTAIYEQIRYCENEVKDEDVVAMKNAIKSI